MVLAWETLSRRAGKGKTSGGGSNGPYRLLPTVRHGSKRFADSIPCKHIPVKWELRSLLHKEETEAIMGSVPKK